jgi:hypothetical protein
MKNLLPLRPPVDGSAGLSRMISEEKSMSPTLGAKTSSSPTLVPPRAQQVLVSQAADRYVKVESESPTTAPISLSVKPGIDIPVSFKQLFPGGDEDPFAPTPLVRGVHGLSFVSRGSSPPHQNAVTQEDLIQLFRRPASDEESAVPVPRALTAAAATLSSFSSYLLEPLSLHQHEEDTTNEDLLSTFRTENLLNNNEILSLADSDDEDEDYDRSDCMSSQQSSSRGVLNNDQWNARFSELEDFIRVHGHPIVPIEYPQNKSLGKLLMDESSC